MEQLQKRVEKLEKDVEGLLKNKKPDETPSIDPRTVTAVKVLHKKGEKLKTVMYEDYDKKKYPKTITHMQYFDRPEYKIGDVLPK